MKKVIISLSILISCAFSEVTYKNQYANQDKKNPNDTYRAGWNFSADIGYTSYLINVTSSELSRVIDYNVLEATLGSSYAYGNWMWGIDTKILVNEQRSKLNFKESKNNSIKDIASIDREEFSLFINYKLSEEFRINFLYRYARLKAKDNYVAFKIYNTLFDYQTNGLASSLVYMPSIFNGFAFSVGAVYSKADIKILETINGLEDDVFINDKSSSVGLKLGVGYNYSLIDKMAFRIISDWYRFDFGKLDVYSQSQKRVFEKASLNEETYAIRMGITYQF